MSNLREQYNTENIKEIMRGKAHIGKNGIHKEREGVCSFQSKDYAKACGSPLFKAWCARKVVKL